LFIVLYWPISFYFVKACVFVLLLSLTRNVSYFTDEVPRDFLITSTTAVQSFIQSWMNDTRKSRNVNKKDDDEINKLIEKMKNDKIKRLIKTIIKENETREEEKDETFSEA